ncbi:isochorismatase family protein [Kineococcus aurantiacus]|uniref:Nicotinamidase-related amidase n=1 Tax=Kineococcus aurantiacus TaxID=37633 RepID=A0A7Y9DJB4_9ACTN|nr:nicotinamidase-related amidase [Kineococcus aurantiacus]
MTQTPWLVLVDLQRIFGAPGSPWAAPRFDAAAAACARLAERFAPNVVLTRFVAPAAPQGAWAAYYEQFPFALVPDDDPLYEVVDGFTGRGFPVVTRPTFGKWGPELAAVTGSSPLVVGGVSTDCCVLSTVLPAADDGIAVTVVADACAGASDADHDRALDALRLYAPLVTVVDSLA